MTPVQITALLAIIAETVVVFVKFSAPRRIAYIFYCAISIGALILSFKFHHYFLLYIIYSGTLVTLLLNIFKARMPINFQDQPIKGPLAVIYALVLFIFIGIGGVSMRGFSYNLFFYSLIFGIPYGYLAYYTFVPKESVTDSLVRSPEFVIPSNKDIRKK